MYDHDPFDGVSDDDDDDHGDGYDHEEADEGHGVGEWQEGIDPTVEETNAFMGLEDEPMTSSRSASPVSFVAYVPVGSRLPVPVAAPDWNPPYVSFDLPPSSPRPQLSMDELLRGLDMPDAEEEPQTAPPSFSSYRYRSPNHGPPERPSIVLRDANTASLQEDIRQRLAEERQGQASGPSTCKTKGGFNAEVVRKEMRLGPRGAPFYIKSNGKRQYLGKKRAKTYYEGRMKGVTPETANLKGRTYGKRCNRVQRILDMAKDHDGHIDEDEDLEP